MLYQCPRLSVHLLVNLAEASAIAPLTRHKTESESTCACKSSNSDNSWSIGVRRSFLTRLLFLPKDAFSLHLVEHTCETFHLILHVFAHMMLPFNNREQLAQYAAGLQARSRVLIALFFNTPPRVTPSWYFLFVHRELLGGFDIHEGVVVCARHGSKVFRTNCCHRTAATRKRINWCAVDIGLKLPQLEKCLPSVRERRPLV